MNEIHKAVSQSYPSDKYTNTQVAAIFSLLLSTSTLLLLLILLLDGQGRTPEQEPLHRAVHGVTLAYFLLQLLMLVLALGHQLLNSSATFHLSIGVKEASSSSITTYGATAPSSSSLSKEDISVFYQRVAPRSSLPPALEPLALPLPGWLLPGQATCLLLALILLLLHLLLTGDQEHPAILVVAMVIAAQQLVLLLLTILTR